MSFASIILALVTLQRLSELALASRNTDRLLARGAIEVGANHYPLVVSVHVAWLIALWVWGRDQDVNFVALSGFLVLQGLRLWILATLGSRWTTRIIVLLGEPLVAAEGIDHGVQGGARLLRARVFFGRGGGGDGRGGWGVDGRVLRAQRVRGQGCQITTHTQNG